jgi:hypothetical protein
MSPLPKNKLRRKPTSFNLDDPTLDRVKALGTVLASEAIAAGQDAPSLANTLRLALRRGLTELEREHPAPTTRRSK